MARPCVGCGFTVDNNGYLNINGLTSSTYPYTAQTTTPNDVFCDSTTNELWVKPWGTAWGIVAKSIKTTGNGAAMTPTTTWMDTNLDTTISFTAVANRMYKHSVVLPFIYAPTTGATFGISAIITTSSGVGRAVDTIHFPNGSFQGTLKPMYIGTETAGTKGYKVMINNSTGNTGTVTTIAGDPNRFVYIIEDIGPAI